MPADTYDQNSVRSVVSINFLFPEAATATTRIKDEVFYYTDYFTKDDLVNPIGRSAGRRKSDTIIETYYYDGKDTGKKNVIGRSVSRQYDETYSQVNYFDRRNNQEKHVWVAEVWQRKTSFDTNYFLATDTEKENPIGESHTTKNIPAYTSTYTFQPTNQKKAKEETGIEMTTLSNNPQTTFTQPKTAPKQPSTEPQNKNGKGKCCSIQ